jgi:hypothetical protein
MNVNGNGPSATANAENQMGQPSGQATSNNVHPAMAAGNVQMSNANGNVPGNETSTVANANAANPNGGLVDTAAAAWDIQGQVQANAVAQMEPSNGQWLAGNQGTTAGASSSVYGRQEPGGRQWQGSQGQGVQWVADGTDSRNTQGANGGGQQVPSSNMGEKNSCANSMLGNIGNTTVLNQGHASLGLSALTSVCAPLSTNVSPKIKQKIVNGEFIEFSQLLQVDDSQGESNKALWMNDQGQLVWEDCRPKQQVTSIHNWTSAFLIFSAIFLEAHPHRTQELLKYASLIRTAAARYQGWGWREYDKQFRMRQQIQPQRSWASIDNELWTLYAATTASSQYVRPKYGRWSSNSGPFRRFSQPTRFSSTQNQQRSFAKVPPYTRFATPSQQRYGGQVCFAFNEAGCARMQCRYLHKCTTCNGFGHGASGCNSKK